MQEIASQIMDFKYGLNDITMESVKMTVLDTLNAIVMGTQEEELQSLIKTLTHFETGSFEILGDQRKVSFIDAAFLLGTASVAVELDEGNQWSKGHPAVHVLPILLLHSQLDKSYSGLQLINDFIRSYEACTYFGKITVLKPDLHAHGTWGVLGSATALAIANGEDLDTLAQMLDLAATFATPTQWTAALEGAGIRNVYIGESIAGGIRAWQLATAKIQAPHQNAKNIYSSILGSSFKMDEPFQQDFFAINNNYFKYHAFCRYVHVPLEAFQRLVEEKEIKVSQIEKVQVKTYARAATLNKKITNNSLSSKFSIPFALASWLYSKSSTHEIFKEQLYKQDYIRDLASKITVIHDPLLDKNYPDVMPAVVEITLNNGEVVEKKLDHALGGPQQKSNFSMVKEKFMKNTKNIISTEAQHQLIAYVEQLEQRSSIADIFPIINNGLVRRGN